MTNSKNTKRALLVSALSVVLCTAMFVGSTFAWFTDSATTGMNKIQAGNLKIALQTSTDGETWKDVGKDPLAFVQLDDSDKAILWEPGCTYKLPELRVANEGNLALKFKLFVNGLSGTENAEAEIADLAEVIDVYTGTVRADVVEEKKLGTLRELMDDTDGAAYGVILPKGETDPDGDSEAIVVEATNGYNLLFHMQEAAGNKYQDMNLDGISFTLTATQYTYENDSFGNDYDESAEYPMGSPAREQELIKKGYVAVANAGDLKTALTSSEKIVLTDEIVLLNSECPEIRDFNGVIDANGKTILAKFDKTNYYYQPQFIYGSGEIRNAVFRCERYWGYYFNGASLYNCTFDGCNPYIEPINDMTIDGCSFINGANLQLVYLETAKTKPEEIKLVVTNNKLEVPEGENNFALGFITYGEAANIWANEEYGQYIVVENNTFKPVGEQDSYIGIWLTDPNGTTKFSTAPLFENNEYVGNAKLVLNQDKSVVLDLK